MAAGMARGPERRRQGRMRISKILTLLSMGMAAMSIAACDPGGGKVVRTLVSPDRAWVAVLVSEIGSEFPGSSCVDTVVVVPNRERSSVRYPDGSRAYVGGCHTLKMESTGGSSTLPGAPRLRWTAPHELHIEFDANRARDGVRTFYSATSLYDGAVTIHNEPQ
jgi:hypothetical protein